MFTVDSYTVIYLAVVVEVVYYMVISFMIWQRFPW